MFTADASRCLPSFLSFFSPDSANSISDPHHRDRKNHPCHRERQTHLPHQIQWYGGIVPHIPVKPEIYNTPNYKLHRRNHRCTVDTSREQMGIPTQFTVHFTYKDHTQTACKKHRPVAVPSPEQLKEDIPASAAQKETPYLSESLYFSHATTPYHKHCLQYG